jgi:hypothetical protein
MACHHMVSTQLSLEGLSKFVAVGVVVPIVVFVFIKLKVWRNMKKRKMWSVLKASTRLVDHEKYRRSRKPLERDPHPYEAMSRLENVTTA